MGSHCSSNTYQAQVRRLKIRSQSGPHSEILSQKTRILTGQSRALQQSHNCLAELIVCSEVLQQAGNLLLVFATRPLHLPIRSLLTVETFSISSSVALDKSSSTLRYL